MHLQAPVGVMTSVIRGKVKLRIPATKSFVSSFKVVSEFALLTEGVVDANGPRHSLLSLNGREHLGRILKSDRSFTQGVADGEEVDEPRWKSGQSRPGLQRSVADSQDDWSNSFPLTPLFLEKG